MRMKKEAAPRDFFFYIFVIQAIAQNLFLAVIRDFYSNYFCTFSRNSAITLSFPAHVPCHTESGTIR